MKLKNYISNLYKDYYRIGLKNYLLIYLLLLWRSINCPLTGIKETYLDVKEGLDLYIYFAYV